MDKPKIDEIIGHTPPNPGFIGHTPPNPGLDGSFVDAVRMARYVGDDVGSLHGLTITVVANGGDRSRWVATNEPGPQFAPRLISRDAYEAVLNGSLDAGGRIVLGGRACTLCDSWNGRNLVAVLSQERTG
jgi:hypothetical protein